MIEGGSSKNSETKNSDNPESKSSVPEKVYQELAEAAKKLNDLLFKGDAREKEKSDNETGDKKNSKNDAPERDEKKEISKVPSTSDILSKSISELMKRIFSDDIAERKGNASESKENDNKDAGQNERKDSKESEVEKKDPILEKIEKILTTPEGIKALIERHPEKAELWKSQLEALDTLNDPEASPAEIRSAQAKLSILKGQLLETAMKDVLSDIGFDVEALQRVVEGESGGTRPDVIAKNNTDRPIEVFGGAVKSGETLSVECKCGGSAYMTNELNNHIPNQLSGQEGKKILVTTSDIKDTPAGAADAVCRQYGARLVVLDVSVADVENAIKEVAKS